MAEGHGSGRPIAVYGAAVANLGIALAKFVAAAITGSSAMLSEGIHSVVDTGNQLLLLVGIRQSHKPADQNTTSATARSSTSGAWWWRSCCSAWAAVWPSTRA